MHNIDTKNSPNTQHGRWFFQEASGLQEHERDQVARMNLSANAELPEMVAWPNWRDEDGLRVIGLCPFCNRTHQHGLTNNATRTSDCRPAGQYRLVVKDEPMPSDLKFMIEHEAADLLTLGGVVDGHENGYASKIIRLDGAKSELRRKQRIRHSVFVAACNALWQSGIFNEREAIQVIDGGSDEITVRRKLLAAFIHSQKADSMRGRLSRALHRAWWMVARGEFV